MANGHQILKKDIKAYLFLGPALILLLIFIVVPLLLAFSYGFTDYYLLKPDQKKFIGLTNFIRIFNDKLLLTVFKNTAFFVLLVLPIQLGLALSLALLANKTTRLTAFLRVSYFSPAILSLVVVAILWVALLNPSSGLINAILLKMNLPAQGFLADSKQALISIVIVSAWQGAGYQMLIFLAGLKAIPHLLYEAARIDGAGKWKQFLFITLPGLKNISIFLLMTTLINAFKLIVQPMVMTGGGPDYSTMTILQYIYEYGYRHRNVGYASAVTLVFMLGLSLLSFVINKVLNRGEES